MINPECDYSDIDIAIEDKLVGVHRCILASQSQFFMNFLRKGMIAQRMKISQSMSCQTWCLMALLDTCVFLHYLYTGKLKASPLEVSTCVDETCAHDACRPAINYALELMYASATFQMKELVLLVQVSGACFLFYMYQSILFVFNAFVVFTIGQKGGK